MKTKRTVGKTVVAIIAIIALAIGVLPLTMGKTGSASADVTPNKTAVLNTSSMTRITAATDFVPLGDRQETPGHNVSVELDVVSSELKNAANADYIKEWLPSPIAQNKDIYQFPMSGVSFNFWRYSADLGSDDPWMWHGPIQGDTNPSNGSWALLYLADGRILLTAYRNASDGSTRKLWEVVKWDGDQLVWNTDAFDWVNGTYIEGTAPRGSIDEVKNFLNPGYSYKVTLHEGFVTEDLQVLDTPMGSGYGFRNPWYVVYKKAIGASDWTVSFAIPLNRNGVIGNASEGHCYSGFEIMANGRYRKTTAGEGEFNNVGCSNITMELDNISIYANWSETKNTITFDDATAEFALAEADSTVTSAGTTYFSGSGYYAGVGGAGQGDKYNSMTYTQHGITINSINAPKELVRTPATRTLNDRPYFTVEYKDRATDDTLVSRQVMQGLNAIEPDYKEINAVYIWETQANDVTGNTVVYGSERTTPFTISFNPNGGTGEITPKYGFLYDEIELPDATGIFTREHYAFAGWAMKEKNGALKKIENYTVTDHDDILYALWEEVVYSVKFYNGDELLFENKTTAFSDIYYEGEEPVKDGSKFIGWSESSKNITDNKNIYAQFKDNYNESVSDKVATVSVVSSAQAKTVFMGRYYSSANNGVTIAMDFINVDLDNAKVYAVLGYGGENLIKTDITAQVVQGKTVAAEFTSYGKYEIKVKGVDETDIFAYETVSEGWVLPPYTAGKYGFLFEIGSNKTINVEVDQLSVYQNGQPFVEEFEYDAGVADATVFDVNGVTFIESSVENSLQVALSNKPKNLVLTFKDTATGNTIQTRQIRLGESAELYKQVGYTVSATPTESAKLVNITENVTVEVSLEVNKYSLSFNTAGIVDLVDIAYGSENVLPSINTEEIYRIIGWAKDEHATVPDYRTGETISMPAENLVLYPVYGYRTYKVTFTDENGNVLESKDVVYMGTALYTGETPVKEGYRFVSWNESVGSVTSDITLTPVFEKLQAQGSDTSAPESEKSVGGKADTTFQTVILVISIVSIISGGAFIVVSLLRKEDHNKIDE